MLKKLLGFVVLLFVGFIVLVVIVGGNSGKTSPSTTPPEIAKPSRPSVPAPTPVAVAPSLPMPPVVVPAPTTPAEAVAPVASLADNVRDARFALDKANADVKAAKNAVATRLHGTPAYQAALKEASAKEDAVKAARSADGNGMTDAATALMTAKGVVGRMDAEAVRTDPTVAARLKDVAAATSNVKMADAAVAEQKRRDDAVAAAKAAEAIAKRDGDAEACAYTIASMALPKFLKDPDSADFDRSSTVCKVVTPGQQWTVSGIIRAKNSFNATVPERWDVIVVWGADDKPTPLSLALNGTIVMK